MNKLRKIVLEKLKKEYSCGWYSRDASVYISIEELPYKELSAYTVSQLSKLLNKVKLKLTITQGDELWNTGRAVFGNKMVVAYELISIEVIKDGDKPSLIFKFKDKTFK